MATINRSWYVLIPLFLIFIVYDRSLIDPTQPLKFLLLSLFCFVSNIALLYNYHASKKRKFYTNKLALLFILIYGLFLLSGLISLFYSADPMNGLYELMKMILIFNFLILGLNYLWFNEDFKINHLSNLLVIAQLLVFVFTIFNLINLDKEFLLFEDKLECGLFLNGNLGSQVLLLTFPFTCYNIVSNDNLKWRILSLIGTALALGLIIILFSRTVYIALAILLITSLLLFFIDKIKLKLRRLGLALILSGFIASTLLLLSYSSSITANIDSFQVRKELWSRTLSSIKESPIIGKGLGSWVITNTDHSPKEEVANNEILKSRIYTRSGYTSYLRPHNDFLWILYEQGLVGVLLYLTLLALALTISFIALYRTSGSLRTMFILSFASIIAYITVAIFSFPKERIEQSLLLSIIFILILYQYSSFKKRTVTIKNKIVLMMILTLTCSSAISFYIGYQRLKSEYYLTKAIIAKKKRDWKSVLQEARQAENRFYPIASNGIPVTWYIGSSLMNLNRTNEAYEYFLKAYQTLPYHVHVINNLATCYVIKREIENAKELYKEALRVNPNFEDARINLSAIYFNENNLEKAWKSITKVYYKSRHPQYRQFAETILQKKYREQFLSIAERNGYPNGRHFVFQSKNFPFLKLYQKSVEKDQTIYEALIEEISPIKKDQS